MSQITRCPSCATMFKVVADQLRISEGWVRCGHCQQVFDASAHLQPSQPPALMPDMALDKMRPPPQPVPRAEPPARAWGTFAARTAPAQADKAPEPAIADGDMKVLQVPESTVPAFLVAEPVPVSRDREMPGLMSEPLPPLAWVDPSGLPAVETPAAQTPVTEWPAIEFAPEPVPKAPSTGYELPSPVLEDGDAGMDLGLDPAPREVVAAPAVQDTPADLALREALNEVLARRTNGSPEPDQPASVSEQEPERRSLAEAEDAALAPSLPDGGAAWREGGRADAASGDPAAMSAEAQEAAQDPELPAAPQLESAPDTDPGADALAGELSFVRAARRKAFWRKTPIRLGLFLLSLMLLCGLLLQVAVQERRWIAATWPALRPALEQLCGPLHCDVGSYRQISAVIVDGSTFHKIKGDQYQFSLTLKNRSETRVEMPAVELTLTDAQDQPVLRRVLTPQDLAAPAELSAQGEWNLAASLLVNLGSTRITGYRVLAFYP